MWMYVCVLQCIGSCKSLAVLDVSCNCLEMLPHSFISNVKIREFYFEENPFLPHIPIPSEQQLEVLPLRVSALKCDKLKLYLKFKHFTMEFAI